MKKRIYLLFLFLLITFFFLKDLPLFQKEEIILITNPEEITVLVNKERRLPSDYVPNNLEEISYEYAHKEKYLTHEAKEAFESLSKDAKELGYTILAVSAYRDYHYQEELYAYYVKEKGVAYASLCSALPGHSEHQTGLALDVEGSNHDYDEFEKSKEFDWMKENAHHYGFILRYPKGKEKITGFKYEPWHYRYVGVEVATYLYENNLTLEEYTKKRKCNTYDYTCNTID